LERREKYRSSILFYPPFQIPLPCQVEEVLRNPMSMFRFLHRRQKLSRNPNSTYQKLRPSRLHGTLGLNPLYLQTRVDEEVQFRQTYKAFGDFDGRERHRQGIFGPDHYLQVCHFCSLLRDRRYFSGGAMVIHWSGSIYSHTRVSRYHFLM